MLEEKRFTSEESMFYDTIQKATKELEIQGDIDLIIGIPFYNEQATLIEVIKTAQESLQADNVKKLIACVGDPAGIDSSF